jgi:hypothetical protein
MESQEKIKRMDEQSKTSGGKSGGGASKAGDSSPAALTSEKYLL